jgi:hypothetical protein
MLKLLAERIGGVSRSVELKFRRKREKIVEIRCGST